MLTPRLYIRRTARLLNRGGFTLVELLVVIGIIAILAGVALGPITNGIKKAKQSSGLQSAHALGLSMFSAANDNSQVYPDGSGGSQVIAQALLTGGYVTDPSIFTISGGQAQKYTGTVASAGSASGVAQTNMSWDFASDGNLGNLTTTVAPYLPLIWSSVAGATPGTEPSLGTSAGAITAAASANNPFGTAGVAVFYCNNASAFVPASTTGTAGITMVTSQNNQNTAPTGVAVLKGGG